MKKLYKRIRWLFIRTFVISLLLERQDTISDNSWRIFRLYLWLYEEDNRDRRLRKLVSFSLFRGLPSMILVSLMGEPPLIKYELPDDLYTIWNDTLYKNYFFEQIEKPWLRDKWYDEWFKIPIIACVKGKNIVIDGNHRLAQQIIHGEIRYYWINVPHGWFALFLKMGIRKKDRWN